MIKELKMTCHASPSQWEIKLTSGLFCYVRYRWGYLSVGIGKTIEDAVRGAMNSDAIWRHPSGGWSGVMSTEDMLKHLIPYLEANEE